MDKLNRLLIATQGLAAGIPLKALIVALQALVAQEEEIFVFGGGRARALRRTPPPKLPKPMRPRRVPSFAPDVTWPVAPGRVVIREEEESLLLAGAI